MHHFNPLSFTENCYVTVIIVKILKLFKKRRIIQVLEYLYNPGIFKPSWDYLIEMN